MQLEFSMVSCKTLQSQMQEKTLRQQYYDLDEVVILNSSLTEEVHYKLQHKSCLILGMPLLVALHYTNCYTQVHAFSMTLTSGKLYFCNVLKTDQRSILPPCSFVIAIKGQMSHKQMLKEICTLLKNNVSREYVKQRSIYIPIPYEKP